MDILLTGAPLARGSCRDRDPIRALFLRPGSGSQLFSGLSGSNLWFPGGSELNCAVTGPRATTNLTTCPVRVLNYKSQQPPSKPRSFNSYVHVSLFIFLVSLQTRILRSYFMNSFGSYFEYLYEHAKNIPNFGIQQFNKSTTISELTTQTASQCSTHARGSLIRLCPEPPERRRLSRASGTPPRTSPAFSYSSPPVQMRSASSVC